MFDFSLNSKDFVSAIGFSLAREAEGNDKKNKICVTESGIKWSETRLVPLTRRWLFNHKMPYFTQTTTTMYFHPQNDSLFCFSTTWTMCKISATIFGRNYGTGCTCSLTHLSINNLLNKLYSLQVRKIS